jgi:glycosyltransferase involved in cell wall biosynthesis
MIKALFTLSHILLMLSPIYADELKNNLVLSSKDPLYEKNLNEQVLWNKLKNVKPATNKHFVVVVASYNNKDWYKKNLDSIFMQEYENYNVIYVDDCSPDGTGNLVEEYIKNKHQEHRVVLIKNKERMGHLSNYYHAIHSCADESIIVLIDGDDWLAHDHVLGLLSRMYDDSNVWLTYGTFKRYPSGECCINKGMPASVIQDNAFRSVSTFAVHLRTFYAGLFKSIKKEDLLFEEKFIPCACDLAMMFPMFEMAGFKSKYIPDILYIYNNANALNVHKVTPDLQQKMDHFIRSKERYAPLKTLEA